MNNTMTVEEKQWCEEVKFMLEYWYGCEFSYHEIRENQFKFIPENSKHGYVDDITKNPKSIDAFVYLVSWFREQPNRG